MSKALAQRYRNLVILVLLILFYIYIFCILEYLLLRLLTGNMSSTIAGGSTGVGLSSRFRACLKKMIVMKKKKDTDLLKRDRKK